MPNIVPLEFIITDRVWDWVWKIDKKIRVAGKLALLLFRLIYLIFVFVTMHYILVRFFNAFDKAPRQLGTTALQ